VTLILEDADVAKALSMSDCIEAMEIAFSDHANRKAIHIPRIRFRSDTAKPEIRYGSNIHIGTTPSYSTAAVRIGGSAGPSDVNAHGMQAPRPKNRNWGFICLINMETGELLAIMQEFFLSGIRVGATSALAAKYLAQPQANSLGLLGSGKLARTNLEGLALARPIRKIKVFSPNPEHRKSFAHEMSHRLEIEVTSVDSAREVVRGSAIVCCATNAGYVSGKPVCCGDWLEEGQLLITLQNSDVNFKKSEVDDQAFVRSDSICINDKESVYSDKQVELLGLIDKGTISWDKVHLLGDIVTGKAKVETGPKKIIYYKNNTGMGIQMSAAGAKIYQRAIEKKLGHEVPTEWFGSELLSWYKKGFFPSP
jgi:alanine dehydrogenase